MTEIQSRVAGAKPWDVVAWKGRELRIVEFKQPTEGFTDSERKFAWGAVELGIPVGALAVVRGRIEFPPRD